MMAGKSFVFRFADIEVREREFSVVKAGEVLSVEPKAFRVLLMLLRNPQKLISKEELLNAVWGDTAVSENSLARAIALLRRLLGDESRHPRFIETVATVGYRFVCKVEVSEDGSAGLEPFGRAHPQGRAAEFVANHEGQINEAAAFDAASKKLDEKSRMRLWKWMIPAAGFLVAGVAVAIWFLHRPLPPPRISAYTQLTHDGHQRWIAGVDQSRVYVNSYSGGPIYQVGIKGGEMVPVPIALPGNSAMGDDASPDGSHLLVGSWEEGKQAATLWNVRIPDGAYLRLGYAADASFSPDGDSVAYVAPEGEIWFIHGDGSGAHKLSSAGKGASWPIWSPDGRVIRFNQGGRLWEISSSGSTPHEVLPGWNPSGYVCCGHWTPDGKFYLFASEGPTASGTQIWALDERRGMLRRPPAEPVQLTTGPLNWDAPWPSEDGKTFFAYGTSTRGELSRIDPTSKALKPFLGGISAHDVSFSKDGRYVAYVSYPDGILWRANRDGSHRTQLVDSSIHPEFLRWSPDGTQILFTVWASPHPIVYTVSSEGGTPKRIMPDDDAGEVFGNWSLDGHSILFCEGSDQGSKSFLRILDITGRQTTQVPESVGKCYPYWSPDGRFILAFTNQRDASNVYSLDVFDMVSQRWTSTLVKGRLGSTSISRDSRFIYFVLSDENAPEALRILRIPVLGGNAELVVDLKDWGFLGSIPTWMNLDPTDAPLMMRDAGSKDVYALTLEEK
jgi:DNA-binding winged helix-turn-helix (wHTH) protein/Tol biopolymer transport system component